MVDQGRRCKETWGAARVGCIGDYAEAVTRAASDLARRTTRFEILEALVDKAM